MNNEILWFSVEREHLASALFGNISSRYDAYAWPRADSHRVALGFSDKAAHERYNPPSLLVVDDDSAPDVLSWLRTFVPETSPLSQFARVMPMSDWERLSRREIGPEFPRVQREDRWACVILGEALAQSDGDTNISSIPISIASSCFSTPVARTNLLHGTYEAIFMCVRRLEQLESDRRFQKRTISVADLEPAWDTLNRPISDEFQVIDAAILVAEMATQYAYDSNVPAYHLATKLADFKGLFSDSIEERVMEFQRLSISLSSSTKSAELNNRASALVAAAAFLVGRGTSHNFLIRRAEKEFSTAFVWYGVIAALVGPSSWDANWSRTVKGIERMLKSRFEWTDVPLSDLSWLEYSWLTNVFDSSVFNDMPKMLPRGLSIEVMPGAACQLRFNDNRNSSHDFESPRRTESSVREKQLENTLSQFLSLATKARELLGNTSGVNTTPHETAKKTETSLPLFDLDKNKQAIKAPRVIRKTKRT